MVYFKRHKWATAALAINIALLCLAICVFIKFQHRNDIVKYEQPITDYSVLEVDCSGGFRGGSTIRVGYNGKNYYVGVNRKQCKGIENPSFYYDKQHDMVFEKDELTMKYVVFYFVIFTCSLLLWTFPEVRR